MPQNGFSIGKDTVLDIVTAQGPLRFSLQTGFSAKQDTTEIKVKGLDGNTYPIVLPDAWSGTFDWVRQNSALDDYFAEREEAYFSGADDPNLSITETIREPGGGISQYRYTNVALKYDDTGDRGGDKTVKQKVSWIAARRRKVV